MASGLSVSGTVYSVSASNISANMLTDSNGRGMYTNATQYRYPRVSSGISMGSHYRSKTFYRLATVGMGSTRLTGTAAITVNWGVISWSTGSTVITSTNSLRTWTPVASDGYQVFMDTATSGTATVNVDTQLYAGTWAGWMTGMNTGYVSGATNYSWAGWTGNNQLYAIWT
jgi:hypothetical protein